MLCQPKKMAAKRRDKNLKTITTINKYQNLNISDVVCSVCKGILIEPVSLPCSHAFCVSCFEASMEETNLVCPLCRKRIGSWLRRARKTRTLVDEQYWKAIKEQFPQQVQNKQNDIDEDLIVESPKLCISAPGEIRKEFEIEQQKQLELIRKKQEEDLKASEDLIRKIQEEENLNGSKTCDNNKLSVLLSSPSTSKCKTGPIDKYLQGSGERKTFTNVPHSLDKSMKQLRNQTVQKILESETCRDSSDSIESECRYFKPIDYRHNPPADIKSPLKVSVRRQTQNTRPNITPPNGVNNFKTNWQTSAFRPLNDNMDNRTNLKRKLSDEPAVVSPQKKQHTSFQNKNCAKKFNNCDQKRLLSNQLVNIERPSENCNNNIAINTERMQQEKADFEFALKLQSELNRTHHLTRRRVAASKNLKGQLTLDEILINSYKVK